MSVGLLILSCPNDPPKPKGPGNPEPNPCPGTGCTCNGAKDCNYDPDTCKCTPNGGGTDIHTHDFTTQYALLGLPNGTNVINQMEDRWANAQTVYNTYEFYSTDPSKSYAGYQTLQGENLVYSWIWGRAPSILFLLKGENLYVWARNDNGITTETIHFDIAIIRNSDGKGWLMQQSNGDPYEVLQYNTTDTPAPYPISTLTSEKVQNASEFGDNKTYSAYIIVRRTATLTGLGDLNDHPNYKVRNVIKPWIR